MTEKTLEKKFTQDDIDNVARWVNRAVEIVTERHDFNAAWTSQVIEGLRPYVSDGNVVQMEFLALNKLYMKKTGRDYITDRKE